MDLRERATELAGALIELAGLEPSEFGETAASNVLDDGQAWKKFQRICEAQGGMRVPPVSQHRQELLSKRVGKIRAVDNRRIAKLAKLAGAPDDKAAGVSLMVKLGDEVGIEQPLCVVHSESPGELACALEYASKNESIFDVREGWTKPLLVSMHRNEKLAQDLAASTSSDTGKIEVRAFPDGETYLEVRLRDLSQWKRHTPVLVDDIISTGHTMIEAVRLLTLEGWRKPICVAVHGIFVEGSDIGLEREGARIVTTNSIPHESNSIDLSKELARAILREMEAAVS